MSLYRHFTTQEQIDDEYRPEARMKDPSAFEKTIASRLALSAEAKKTLQRRPDISYGPTLMEKLDIYPAKRANAPIAVFIHGGYWFDGRLRKENYIWVAKGFEGNDVTTAIIDYQICPKVTIDEIVRQCRAAVAWLYRNAESFGANRDRIYITGNSAGGHLTAMLAVTDWEEDYGLPNDVVKGGCPISGLYDLSPFPYSWLQPKIQLTGQQIKRNSPMGLIKTGAAPLLISWGAEESGEFWRQSQDFGAAWADRGNRMHLHPQDGCNHHSATSGFADPASAFCKLVIEHMESCWTK